MTKLRTTFLTLITITLLFGLSACAQLPQLTNLSETLTRTAQSTPEQAATAEVTEGALDPTEETRPPLPPLPINEPHVPHDEAFINPFKLAIIQTKNQFAQPRLDSFPNENTETVFAPNTKAYQNLWNELSDHFFIEPAHITHFEDYLNYYQKRPNYFKRVSIRAKPYLHFILNAVKQRNMPYEIALLPIVESGYYPYARSYVDAAGLWQFMPATGYMYGLKKNWWYDGRQDIERSTLAALDYLQVLYKQNNYDWLLALAAYNSGYGNILKAQKQYLQKHPNGSANFWNIRTYLPKETQHYVPQLLAITYLVRHRNQFGIELETIPNEPYFAKPPLSNQISLTKLSQALDTRIDTLKTLNPGYLRLATPPHRSEEYSLLLPIDKIEKFHKKYQENPQYFAVNWVQHKIRSGESLSVIAHRYRTSSKEIKKLNGMKTSFLRAGKTLLIPLPQSHTLARQPLQKSKRYQGQQHIHEVRSGESLWTIARYYNTTPRKLCEWNRISIRNPIRKGQHLIIHSDRYGKELSHTLKTGESLWLVAKKYQVTTQELCNWNGIKRSDILQPGTKITVWVKS